MNGIAIVAIGRNEGERLKHCLRRARELTELVVYVDSGSTDGSVEFARSLDCLIVELDIRLPFTAARARNAGLDEVRRASTGVKYIQFVDGDCTIQQEWLPRAVAFLAQTPQAAIVFGRRRERYPERSIYNQLCDWEWEVAEGEVSYCGGDILIRADAINDVDGYRDTLIAGEEPELCLRLRRAGWTVHALNEEMTMHDADMTRFSQWWNRMKRSGYAYAAGAWLHGRGPERHWIRETLRPWFWVALPVLAMLMMAQWIGGTALLLLAIYPLQVARLVYREPGTLLTRFQKAFFNTLARVPELSGQFKFAADLLRGKSEIIEYKS